MNTKKPVNPFTAGTRKSEDLQAENREHNSARDISKHYLKYPLIIFYLLVWCHWLNRRYNLMTHGKI